jgi:hypothetical protein
MKQSQFLLRVIRDVVTLCGHNEELLDIKPFATYRNYQALEA